MALKEQSQAVIDIEEQYEVRPRWLFTWIRTLFRSTIRGFISLNLVSCQVFDNPKSSDPTHSILAKDHVDLILNEPAGRVAQIVVENTVGLVVHVCILASKLCGFGGLFIIQ